MSAAARRLALTVRGVVQAVGFRPFLFRLAAQHAISGWARNDKDGVHLEIEGAPERLDAFVAAMKREAPPGAAIRAVASRSIEPVGEAGFRLLESDTSAEAASLLPPDLAPCPDCLAEIAAPGGRRFAYPFTNCTRCGPRYSIVLALPYDRSRTTMRAFPLCDECAREYRDPSDRRFHAQPMACPRCGPRLVCRAARCAPRAAGAAALARAADAVREGRVLALKGVGGYQLLVDAANPAAVARLRERKQRPHKPFAVMFPSLEALLRVALVSTNEAEALGAAAAPIVLVRRRPDAHPSCALAAEVAPQSPWIGAMLPSSPLHRLLLDALGRPVVCTSGNLTNEPICTDVDEAHERLGAIADVFLDHDRPIARPVDDSLVRVGPTGVEVLRRARGYAPLPLARAEESPTVLALGGHLKSTLALAAGGEIIVSQHLGDLDSPLSITLLERTADDLVQFFERRPEAIACDEHPDYASSRLAARLAARFGAALAPAQHHHAHVAAVMAEHGLKGPALGFAWDGVGLGADGDLWGGEALVCEDAHFRRAAHLRPFRLPGGEAAIREPRRAAAGILHAMFGADFAAHVAAWFGAAELRILEGMLARGVNAPRTTSVGRLFDAVAAIAGGLLTTSFEGQAAMHFEYAAEGVEGEGAYPLSVEEGDPMMIDWAPLVRALLADKARGAPLGVMSARFHEALAAMAVTVAARVSLSTVVLAGGCFQNLRLATRIRARLEERGHRVYAAREVPPNDGGLSLGQAWIAGKRFTPHVTRERR